MGVLKGKSRGGGKSFAVRMKAKLMCINYPGIKILILRRTFPELRENHILPLLMDLKGIATYKETEKSFTFPNGSRLRFGYCDTETDVLQYQGQEFDIIFMDEATQFTEYQYNTLTACLRGANDFPKRFYLTCNPGGVGHEWVKRLFIDREYRNTENAEEYTFIAARVYDNKALIEKDTGYVKMLENLPEDLRRAWLEGDWNVFAGQYFKEFREDIHTIEPFEIPKEWRRYRTIDYGLDMLACYFIAIDTLNRAYVYKEIYESGLIVSEAAKKILDYTNEEIYQTYAPPDIWNRQKDTGKSMAELFLDNGVYLTRADNNRVQGWMALKEWLKPFTDETGEQIASLRIFRNCKNLIRTLPMLQFDNKNPNDTANEPHEITHSCIVGDTIINTPDGDKPIKELVGTNGYVYCYDEANKQKTVAEYSNVRITQKQAPILKITMEDGRQIRCTADHKVLTLNGWKQAKELSEQDEIVEINL